MSSRGEDPFRGKFEEIQQQEKDGPARSADGWIVFIRGIDPQVEKDELSVFLSEFGRIKSLALPCDKKSGDTKGYALVEYHMKEDAKRCIEVC